MSLNTPSTLLILLVAALAACSPSPAQEEKVKEKVYKVPVETTLVENRTITNTYRTTAILEARAESKVTNKVSGMIDTILVEEGMSVKKGQVLGVVSDPFGHEKHEIIARSMEHGYCYWYGSFTTSQPRRGSVSCGNI